MINTFNFKNYSDSQIRYIFDPLYDIYEEDIATSIIDEFLNGKDKDSNRYREMTMNRDEFSCLLKRLCLNKHQKEYDTDIYDRLEAANYRKNL